MLVCALCVVVFVVWCDGLVVVVVLGVGCFVCGCCVWRVVAWCVVVWIDVFVVVCLRDVVF